MSAKTTSNKKKEQNAVQGVDQSQPDAPELPVIDYQEPKFVFNCTPEKERKPHSKKEIIQMYKKFFEQSRTKRVAKAKKLVNRRKSRAAQSSATKMLFAAGGEEIDFAAMHSQILAAASGSKDGAAASGEEEEEELIDEGYDEDGNWIMKRDDEMLQGLKESMVRFIRRKKIRGTRYVMEWVVSQDEQRKARMGKIDWRSSPVLEVKGTYTSLVRQELNKDFKCRKDEQEVDEEGDELWEAA